jgi:hypothetical protein
MNQEIAQKWAETLKSGAYQQGRGALRRQKEEQYCCLGVLCDMHAKAVGGEWTECKDDDAHLYHTAGSTIGSINFLPGAVREWAGLLSSNPRVKSQELCKKYGWGESTFSIPLSSLNDGDTLVHPSLSDAVTAGKMKVQMDFDQIADVILNNWEYL